MFKTFVNAWKIADLRKKLLFTFLIILLYRVGASIPVPYLDPGILATYMASTSGSIFDFLNIMSGQAFAQATLFALGVSPYITASIVIQLLTVAIPALERIAKDGPDGQKKITQITRYVTVGLALITAIGYYMLLKNSNALVDNSFFAAVVIVACYCAGSSLVMWLAEKVNEFGVGNGISMILLANIIASLPSIAIEAWNNITNGISGIVVAIITIVIILGTVVFVVFMQDSERRLPIQYAKKVVGRKQYGGQNSTLPIKLTMTGVMPIIFANSIITIPATVALFFDTPKEGSFWEGFLNLFSPTSWFYVLITFLLIIAFAYFYAAISFNPIEISNNLKKNGGFIPGIRPGKPTSDYITRIVNRIILIGALMLGIIAVVPMLANVIASIPAVASLLGTNVTLSGLSFSGNSIIIVVGVILETTREIESQMSMRHYKGFLE